MDKNEDIFRLEYYCELDQFDEAIKLLDELIENKCDYVEEAFVFLVSRMNENHLVHEKVYQLIKKGLMLFPDNMMLKLEMCLNFQIRGFQKEAMALCRQLTKEYPFSLELWYLQSELYQDCGDYENAIDSINYAISCSIDDASELTYQLIFSKAQCLFKNASYYQAIGCFIELMSYKEFVKARVNPYLAECYMRIGDYETAFDLLNKIIGQKEIEDEIAFYGDLIYCCLHTGRQIVAIDLLADALKLYPNKILDYISSLNLIKNYQTETEFQTENCINSGELARKFFLNNTHYN